MNACFRVLCDDGTAAIPPLGRWFLEANGSLHIDCHSLSFARPLLVEYINNLFKRIYSIAFLPHEKRNENHGMEMKKLFWLILKNSWMDIKKQSLFSSLLYFIIFLFFFFFLLLSLEEIYFALMLLQLHHDTTHPVLRLISLFFSPFSSSFYSVHQRNEFLELSTAIASYCLTNAAREMQRWCMACSVWNIRMSWVGPIRWNRNLSFRRAIKDRPSGRLLYTPHQHTGAGTSNLILNLINPSSFMQSHIMPYHLTIRIRQLMNECEEFYSWPRITISLLPAQQNCPVDSVVVAV